MKIKFIIIFLLIINKINAQTISQTDLIGEWLFIELQDEKGIKHTKIPNEKFGKELIENVNRDSYIFKDNGEYISSNPYKKMSGTWFYDSENNEINLELRIEPESPYLKHLKKANIVTKRDDGNYYQKAVKKKIIFFEENKMIISDRDNYVLIYNKK